MGGLASLLGGLGGAAGQYREQALTRWQQSKDKILELITSDLAQERDPQRRSDLISAQYKIDTARPGVNIVPILKDLHNNTVIHPESLNLMQGTGIIPPEPKPAAPPPPGPTAPGAVAGTGSNALAGLLSAPSGQSAAPSSTNPVSGLISDLGAAAVGGNGGGGGVSSGAAASPAASPAPPPTAQPGTSPVQPVRQSAAAAPAPFNPASVPGVGKFGSDVNGITGGGYGALGNEAVDRLHKAQLAHATGGPPVPGLLYNDVAQLQASEAANMAELNRQKLLDQYTLALGPQRTEALANAVDKMNTDPRFAGMPDVQKFSLAAEAIGMKSSIIPAGYMNPVLESAGTPGSAAPPGTLDSLGNPVVPTGNYRIQRDKLNGKPIWTPINLQHQLVQTNEGGIAVVNPQNPNGGIQPIPNAVAPSQNTPHYLPNATGGVEVVTPGKLAAGAPPVDIPGAVTPGMLPHQSVSQTPGSLPTVVQHTVGGVGSHAGIRTNGGGASAPSTNRSTPGASPASEFGSAQGTIEGYADDIKNGRTTLAGIPAKERNATRQYMNRKGIVPPTPLSAAGQANVQAIDAVDMEINDINADLAKLKDNTNLASDYMQYKHLGLTTPYNDLFTKLSFEGLRSAAAALKGNNSRAYPIIQRAFEHVPNLDRVHGAIPDSVPTIRGKLMTMQKILMDARQTAMHDQTKSGVILPMDTGAGSNAATTSPADLKSLSTEELMRRLTGGNK